MNVKNQGFTLLGVILSAAVGIIVMAALASQLISSSRQTHILEAKMESMNLKQEVMNVLSKDANCQASFAGLTGLVTVYVSGFDTTNVTSQINSMPTNPLKAIMTNYTLNDRYIQVNSIKLQLPQFQSNGTLNNGPTQFEYRVKFEAQEKTAVAGVSFFVDGPIVTLNAPGGNVNAAPTACVAPPTPCITFGTKPLGFGALGAGGTPFSADLGVDWKFATATCYWPVGASDCSAYIGSKSGNIANGMIYTNGVYPSYNVLIQYCY